MFLHIHDQLTLGELQERFNDCFPYLKLEFYSEAHKRFEASEQHCQLDARKHVGEVRKLHKNGSMEIKSWYTVSKVEQALKDDYGLNAQVFRSNKNGEWVQTTLSDSLTLQEQSELNYDENLNR